MQHCTVGDWAVWFPLLVQMLAHFGASGVYHFHTLVVISLKTVFSTLPKMGVVLDTFSTLFSNLKVPKPCFGI